MIEVEVRGRYLRRDGTPADGTVIFTPRSAGASAAENVLYPRLAVRVDLDETGAFTAQLQATDDPAAEPTGWTYRVEERISGLSLGRRTYDIQVPASAAGDGIDLADVAPVDPAIGEVTGYVTTDQLTEEAAARGAADDALQAALDAEAEAREALDASLGTAATADIEDFDPAGSAAAVSASLGSAALADVSAFDVAGTAAAAQAAAEAAAVLHAGPSDGVDDTPALQALLTAARTAGGGVVVGKPGAQYKIRRLVIGSNTTLDFGLSDVAQVAGEATNLITNYSDANPVAIAADAAVTAGSNVVTTALADQAVPGQTVYVSGAGSNGYGELIGNVSAVDTTANTITLTKLNGLPANATATVSGAAIQLSNRDTGIRIYLRNAARGANGPNSGVARGSAVGGHSIFLRGVDHFEVDVKKATSTAGISFIWPTNAAHGTVRLRDCAVHRTGVQVVGPIYDLRLYAAGQATDDLVNLCGNVYPDQTNTSGDVIGVTVEDIISRGTTAASALKLNAGQGNLVDSVVVSGRIMGSSTTGYPVWIGTDTVYPATDGGQYGTIDLGLLDFRRVGGSVLWLRSVDAHSISARIKATTPHPVRASGTYVTGVGTLDVTIDAIGDVGELVKVTESSKIGTLRLRVSQFKPSSGSAMLVNVSSATAIVEHLLLDSCEIVPDRTVSTMVSLSAGTVRKLTVRDCNIVYTDSSNGQNFVLIGGATVGNIDFRGCSAKYGDTLVRLNSGSLGRVSYDHVTTELNQRLLNTAVATDVVLSDVRRISCTQIAILPASGVAVTIRGTEVVATGSGNGLLLISTNGANSVIYGPTISVDVSQIRKTLAGATAYNSNGALSCGVGTVQSNGTNFVNLATGATY